MQSDVLLTSQGCGKREKMSAVADATDNAVKMMVCCENDGAEGVRLENRRVMAIKATPDTQVTSASSDVLIRGEEGFGKEARVDPWLCTSPGSGSL